MKQTICLLIFICISNFNFARYCEVPIANADKLIEYYRNLFVDAASSTVSVNYFTSFYGNSESNVFGKSVMIGTDYYVIGTNGIQATLTRLNSLGSEIWTAVVNDTSSWADLIVTSSNNILLVGSVDIDLVTGTTGARNLLVGVCNTNGTFLSLQSSNYNEQESFTRILFNPNPANSNFPYYATGNVVGTSIDKVFVSTISNSGSIGSRFEFDSGNDDEFYQDIVLLNNAGDLALVGNRNTTGYIARVDKNLDPIDDGFLMDNYSSVFSLYALSSNPSGFQYIISGTNASSKGIIGLFNGTPENSKIYTANGLSKVYNIVHGSGNEYYALGLGSVGGVSRTVVIKFEYNSGSLIFHWVRSINTATTPQVGGKIVIDAVTPQLIFSCGLLNPSGGSGSYEGLFSVQNLEFNNCNFENILIDFVEGNVTFSTNAISSQSMQINLPVNKNSQFIGLNSQYICEVIPSCEVDFAFANQSCGDVVFQSSTKIGGSISYCWDFGDNPPCGSTAPTIIHNYNNNGTYNVCLTVNNGLASCKICKQITINNSDHEKPIIVCAGTYTVDFCTNLPSPQVSGYPSVTDNLDPNPNISYNDILTQTSSCQRLYTREWTAIDNCGNSVKCQQKIILKDLLLPYISCPADITIQCFQSTDTTVTGGPKYHDYCRSAPSLSIKNDTILHNICTTEIKRSFIVVDACNNRDTCIQKIFVVDKTPPQILCAGTNLNPIECTSTPNFVQPTILSNQCGGKVAITHVDSRSTVGCSTTVQRIYTVTDQCGNSTTCVQEIRMVDTKPPVITNCGRKIEAQGITQTNGSCAATVQIISPTVTDNCGSVGIINSYNNTSDASGIYPVGETIIVWSAIDQCGLKSECRDTVIVLNCKSNKTACGWAIATCAADSSNGPVGVLYDLTTISSQPTGTDLGTLIPQIHPLMWNKNSIGDVFGITHDNGSNIYLAASSIYELDGYWIPSVNGPAGPAGIYRTNLSSINISSIFTSTINAPSLYPITGSSIPNTGGTGNCIGNIAYDITNNQIFATNLEDGRIYRISSAGVLLSAYDPFSLDNGITGKAEDKESLWGIGVITDPISKITKVYFAREKSNTNSKQIWSIELTTSTGEFNSPTTGGNLYSGSSFEKLEIDLIEGDQIKITDIEFSYQGNMIVAERGSPHSATIIQYKNVGNWVKINNLYTGASIYFQNSCAGGVDYGFLSENQPNSCDELAYSTHNCADLPTISGFGCETYGIEGINPLGNSISPSNYSSDYFIDFDGNYSFQQKWQVGDVDIIKCKKCPMLETCCKDSMKFNSIAILPITIHQDLCNISITHPGLTDCQYIIFEWGDNSSNSGPFTGTGLITISHTYTFSGNYNLCYTIFEKNQNDSICYSKKICKDIMINCCNPCDDLSVNVEPSRDPKDSCCYNIDISNLCADGYFDKVELCSQDPSVVFGNQTLNPAWNYCNSTTATTTCFEHNSGHIPVGTHTDVLKFCVDTQTNYIDTICWKKISGGENFTVGIDCQGRLWAWGDNGEYKCGTGSLVPGNQITPIMINDIETWVDVSAGLRYALALDNTGTIYAWGNNTWGQCGKDPFYYPTVNTPMPIANPFGKACSKISAGYTHNLAIMNDGSLYSWGATNSGALGFATGATKVHTLSLVVSNLTWQEISAGWAQSLGIKSDGTLWAWGAPTYLHNLPWMAVPQQIDARGNWTKISTGNYSHIALNSDGELFTWGDDDRHRVGNGPSPSPQTTIPYPPILPGNPIDIPTKVTNPTGIVFKDIYMGFEHSLALSSNGVLYSCGANDKNQLCQPHTYTPYNHSTLWTLFTPVAGLPPIESIMGGKYHTFLKESGQTNIHVFGWNLYGQLGVGYTKWANQKDTLPYIIESSTTGTTSLPPYSFKLKFYHEGEVACDKMFDIDCLPDTLNSCLDISNIVTECVYEQNKYKLTFTVSNTSNPAFTASSIVVSSTNPNLVFTPSIIDFTPDLNSGQSQTVMTCIMTSPFPYAAGVANLQFQLISSDGRTICSEAEQHRVLLDECPKPCGYTCCEDGTPEDFESKPLGPLTTFQNGYVKSQGTVDVVQGGCDQSAKSILLNGGAKGLQPGIVSLVKGGVVGPIDFVKKDSMYCIKLCAYVPSFKTSPYDAKIGISVGSIPFHVPVGEITIPLNTVGWQAYTVQFTSPITTNIVNITNNSPAPVDAPTSVQLDNICFGGSRPLFDDPIPPELNCPSDLTITDTDQDCIVPYTIPNINITDNYGIASSYVYLDGTITSIGSSHNLSNSLVHEIKYVAEDFCGNKDSCSYQIYINCLMSGDSCYCGGFSDVYFFNQNFTTPVRCNERGLIWLDCPEDQKVFYLHGDLACTESCNEYVKYNVIDAQTNQLITSGSVSTNGTANHWDIPLDYSDFLQNKPFVLQVVGHCGSDSCICQVLFSIKTCDSVCCQGPKALEKIVKDAITISVNDFLCKATINIADLPHSCNIKVKTINWKDGTIVNGPFAPGSMVMHTYNSPNVGYIVEVIVEEFDDQGKLCNEYKLKLPISLNCVECCRKSDYKIFTNLVNQGFVVNVQDCQVTVTSPQFGSCVFFESVPNFGAGSVPVLMQIPASGSWTYNYLNSGTYTICVQVSEYPNGDITQKPCRTKLMCTPVTVNCSDTCTCAGFSNLMFYYDKKKKLSVECSDTVKLECPPDDCVWTFTGNLLCKNNCQSSNVSWSLVNSISGLELASGSTVAYPAFGISVPQGIITMGGEFDLILNGSCGNQEVCNCVIHIVAPGCDSSCNCNIDDFLNDVNMGIGPVTIFDDCLVCFSPKALTQCDQVEWYLLPSNRLILSSVGSQLVCYRFGNLEEYVLRMVVKRKNHDGSICEEAEKLVVIQPNCSTLFDHYFDNQLCNISSGRWNSIRTFSGDHLTNITLESRIDENRLTLNGNLSESGKLISDEFCINNGILNFELLLSATKFQALKTGTRLLVEFVPTAALDPAIKSSTSGSLQSEVLIPETFSSDFIIKGELLLDLMSDQSHCEKDQILGRLIISLSNLLPGDLINPNSSVHLEKVCISQSGSQNISSIPSNSVVVFPNPSSGFFEILAKNYESSFSKLEIYYASGGLVKAVEWDHFKRQFSFEEALPRGVYILKVKTRFGMRTLKVVCN